MPRLFTALEIPEPVRLRLSLIRAPLNGARWIDAEDMHITLRFAGDIDARTADEFADLLADVQAQPFELTIRGVGAFGGRDPRVLWAGVEPSKNSGDAVDNLHRLHERAARLAGLEPEPRAFKPHVTLARMRRVRAPAVAQFLEENGDLHTDPFTVGRFVLLSARPGSGGPPYAMEAAYPLMGSSWLEDGADAAEPS